MKEDYGDLPLEDFTHGLYENVKHIKYGIWMAVFLLFMGFLT